MAQLVDARGFQLTPDLAGSIRGTAQEFTNISRQNKAEENKLRLQGLLGQGKAGIDQARQEFPQETQAFEKGQLANDQARFQQEDEGRQREISNFILRSEQASTLGSPEQQSANLRDQAQKILDINPAADVSDTLELADDIDAGRGEARFSENRDFGIRTGILKELNSDRTSGLSTKKSFQPVTLVNDAGEKMLVSPTTDNKTGAATLEPFQIPEGFGISTETPEEKRAANVLAAGDKASLEIKTKGAAGRRQSSIAEGLVAADGFANVERAISLLDSVQTGGIDRALQSGKRLFGIESADEAELSNRMGKAVLSQLRNTFGAAFTAQEGKQLTDIEANYGKSTEGNRRLLKQVKKLILRSANRGLKAAIAEEDFAAAQDIKDSLAFRLNIDEEQADDLTPEEQAELTEREAAQNANP